MHGTRHKVSYLIHYDSLLQNAVVLLQNATVITKCDDFITNATVITKCDDFITKCDSYYKLRHLLQIATVHMVYVSFKNTSAG